MTRLEECQAFHREMQSLFTYKADTGDVWRNYKGSVKLNKPFMGDCEDFSLTFLEIVLGRKLIYPVEAGFHMCSMAQNQRADHGVGSVDIDGITWVSDINRKELTPIKELPYTFLYHKRCERNAWYTTVVDV